VVLLCVPLRGVGFQKVDHIEKNGSKLGELLLPFRERCRALCGVLHIALMGATRENRVAPFRPSPKICARENEFLKLTCDRSAATAL